MDNEFLKLCFLIFIIALCVYSIKVSLVEPIKNLIDRRKNENKDGDGI